MKGTRIPQWIINQQDFGTMVFRFFVSSLKMPFNTHPITSPAESPWDCVGSWQISSRSAAERTPSEPWHSSPGGDSKTQNGARPKGTNGDSFNLGNPNVDLEKMSFFMVEMSFQVHMPFVGITCCAYHAICGTTMFFVASRSSLYYTLIWLWLENWVTNVYWMFIYTCYPLVI